LLDALSQEERQAFVARVQSRPGQAYYHFKSATPAVRADKACILAAVKACGKSLYYASDDMKADKDVIMAAVKQDGSALLYVDKHAKIWNDEDFVLPMVTMHGYQVIEHVSPNLQRDKRVWVAVVQQDGNSLQHAPEEFRKDQEVVLAAARNSPADKDEDCLNSSGICDRSKAAGAVQPAPDSSSPPQAAAIPAEAATSTTEAASLASAEAATSSTSQLVFYTAECSVCLANFKEGEKAARLNCGHLFHEECLRSWLGMRDACPYCNTAGARKAMKNVQVALINDPTRLNELNIYVARGAMPLLCMWNASMLLTQDGRELLIYIAIRRSLLRYVLLRSPNAGRFVTIVLVMLVYTTAAIVAKHVNQILQTALEVAFEAAGVISILSGAEYLGKTVQPFFVLLMTIALAMVCCIGVRAHTVAPPSLTAEFKAENICVVPGGHAGSPVTEDLIEVQSKSMEASTSAESTVVAEPEGLST